MSEEREGSPSHRDHAPSTEWLESMALEGQTTVIREAGESPRIFRVSIEDLNPEEADE